MAFDGRALPGSELTIRVNNLPPNTQTWDLYHSFEQHGTIVYVEVLQDYSGAYYGRVKFSPVPRTDFWSGSRPTYPMKLNSTVYSCPIKAEPPRRANVVPSPIRRGQTHPAVIDLHAEQMAFGIMVGETDMMVMKTLRAGPDRGITFRIQLARKQILAEFLVDHEPGNAPSPGAEDKTKLYRFEVDFGHLRHFYHLNRTGEDGTETGVLIMPLEHPPKYSWKRDNVEATFSERSEWSSNETWYRAVQIADGTWTKRSVSLRPTGEPHPAFIDLGRWTTFRFVFGNREALGVALRRLDEFNIVTRFIPSFCFSQRSEPVLWSEPSQPVNGYLTRSNAESLALLDLKRRPSVNQLSFDVRYHLEACLSRGVFVDHNITDEFIEKLWSMKSTKATLLLGYFSDKNCRVLDPMTIFTDVEASGYFPWGTVPNYCALVRKVVVTPTTIRINPPTVECTNRVLRNYKDLQDRFLRVQFTDEYLEGSINSYAGRDQHDDLFKRVYATLLNGIQIGDRVFEFLAFGNSQIRECGAYFFCPTEYLKCNDIRRWMGEFSHIKVIARYAARLGQCFSTTRAISSVTVPSIRPIPDIERNKFCFTDGVGKMSRFLAEMVMGEIGTDWVDLPSAFQFRMGGCKGMLTVWPEVTGIDVHIRKSQEKFKAIYNGLEVIRWAQHSTPTLNRQTITILSSLGVPDRVFLDLLGTQLRGYEDAMGDSEIARHLLRRYVDFNQVTIMMAEMVESGYIETAEPFVMAILHLWRVWSVKLLREKARIMVDKGAFNFGCVDETGTLRGHSIASEGSEAKRVEDLPQIFLQVPDADKAGAYRTVTGLCIVGRNPSLHPGDIRVVEAVDVPALRHLRDLVVFPSTGDRDLPGMLSGGDLDGDDFFVIWDQDLIPPLWNHPPMNFRGSSPLQVDREVNSRDLCEFFVHFLKNNILPQIALAHLATADSSPDGVMDRRCLELAMFHSTAVDYVKTGIESDYPKALRPTRWPHFMEDKPRKYRSHKVLGKLFDRVQPPKPQPSSSHKFDSRILGRAEPGGEVLAQARSLKSRYDRDVRRLMAQRELNTEIELWTGFALTRPRVGSGYKLAEDLGREIAALKQRYRDACKKAAGGATYDKLAPFVVAMYRITEEEVKLAAAKPGAATPLISFPWMFHWVMNRLATGRHVVSDQDVALDTATGAPGKRAKVHAPVLGDGEDGQAEGAAVTHLPDGRVLHRGEVLELFDVRSNTPVEQDDTVDKHETAEAEPDGLDGISTELVGMEIGAEVEEAEAVKMKKGEEDEEAQGQDGAPQVIHVDVEEEDDALDRWMKLANGEQ